MSAGRVGVVGLGRIGLPLACLLRDRGVDVVGVDASEQVRARLAAGALDYHEPNLHPEDGAALLPHVASHIGEVEADTWVIAIGTTVAGELADGAVESVVRELAARPQTRLILIESTISPAAAARLATLPTLVAVCPERARPGQVRADLAAVPRLIGGATAEATTAAVAFYAALTDAPLHACTAVEAALAKLAENAEREVRIAFANELADVAAAHGVDVERVIALANSHPRTAILRPGIGVGGHCLPMATRWFARANAGGVTGAARAMHDTRPRAIAQRITEHLAPGARVCVIGRTYRPNTAYQLLPTGEDPYASPAVALIAALRELGFEVTSWDPADEVGSREEAERGAQLVYIAVPHDVLTQT